MQPGKITSSGLVFLRKFFPLIALLLAGCALDVVRHSTILAHTEPAQVRQYLVLQAVLVRFDTGYERTIRAGAVFAEIGTLKQGNVLKPVNIVFTIEGTHVHEAYPVVDDGRIVGFYLPVEKAFALLSNPVALLIQEREIQK
jgi:hypothetical protein